MSEALTVLGEEQIATLANIDKLANNLTVSHDAGMFTGALIRATAMTAIQQALEQSTAIMSSIYGLQNNPVGFMTDRASGSYSEQELVPVVLEAALYGAQLINNEITVIKGRCYLGKKYFARELTTRLGQGMWRLNKKLIETSTVSSQHKSRDGGTYTKETSSWVVETTMIWTENKVEHSEVVTHNIVGDNVDQVKGKADRKAGKCLLSRLTGQMYDDGDIIDADPIAAPTTAAPKTAPLPVVDVAQDIKMIDDAVAEMLEQTGVTEYDLVAFMKSRDPHINSLCQFSAENRKIFIENPVLTGNKVNEWDESGRPSRKAVK